MNMGKRGKGRECKREREIDGLKGDWELVQIRFIEHTRTCKERECVWRVLLSLILRCSISSIVSFHVRVCYLERSFAFSLGVSH